MDPFQAVEATDDTFWDQFWSESAANISDVFTLIPASEIRSLRDENPSNLATLCYKVSIIPDYVFPCSVKLLLARSVFPWFPFKWNPGYCFCHELQYNSRWSRMSLSCVRLTQAKTCMCNVFAVYCQQHVYCWCVHVTEKKHGLTNNC